MRDLLVLAIFYCSLPVSVFRPFVGLCVLSWLSYLRPQDLAWSINAIPFATWSFLATAAGVGLGMLRGSEVPARLRTQTVLLVCFLLWSRVSLHQAITPSRDAWLFAALLSAVVVAVLTTGLVSTWERLQWLWIVIAFSLGLLGVKYALYSLVRGGVRFEFGPGGFMTDNNSFAMALNMAIPLLMAVAQTSTSKWLRIAALIMTPLCIITIILTFSRGGLLTLGVVGAFLIGRSGRPLVAALALILGVTVFWLSSAGAVRDAYFARAMSIAEYQEDQSVQGRFTEWRTAGRIAADYPLFGVGPGNLRSVHAQYSDQPDQYKVSHNSFLQILVDSGVPAFSMLLAMLAIGLWRLQVVRSLWSGSPAEVFAGALQVSIVGYIVGGFLLNMAYFDLIYQLLGLTVALEIVAPQASGPSATVQSSNDEIPWWKQQEPARGTSFGSPLR